MSRLGAILDDIDARLADGRRIVVAVAGAPGAGKSTLADHLDALVRARHDQDISAVLPMDGYHFDNAIITPRGLLARKGSPATFDFDGYRAMVERLVADDGRDVAVPLFDRDLDLARAGARIIGPEHRIVITEGNYLLLDLDPWATLAPLFDITVFLQVPREELLKRLVKRWLDHGMAPEAAEARARSNDMANAETVLDNARGADHIIGPYDMTATEAGT